MKKLAKIEVKVFRPRNILEERMAEILLDHAKSGLGDKARDEQVKDLYSSYLSLIDEIDKISPLPIKEEERDV